VYRTVTEADITCLVVDDRKRKIIVGDHKGNIVVRLARFLLGVCGGLSRGDAVSQLQ
jgi:hypothetical protein